MNNIKVLDSSALYANLNQFSKMKVCAMVKANAYGHGLKEIVNLLKDKVEYFGVANVSEGLVVRKLTERPVLIVGKTDDFSLCKKHNLEIMIDDENDIKQAVKHGLQDQCHLKINCGMNRFGAKSNLSLKLLNMALEENKIKLKSIYTHFPNSTNKSQTKKQYLTFVEQKKLISQQPIICLGGSEIVDYNFDFQMLRVGIGLYGYEHKNLHPVMKIYSKIVKIFFAKKGETIGYGKKYVVKHDAFYGVVPMGYADGIARGLSGKIFVVIGGKKFEVVGDICMDVFFVKVDRTVKVGDKVCILSDAELFAKKLGTISYEILANFSGARATTKIV